MPQVSTTNTHHHGSPLWLTHHWPEGYERCVKVGRHHICARCLVLYPIIVVIGMIFDSRTSGLAVVGMWLLPLPMTIEWVLEHFQKIRYSQVRQMSLSALAGIGIGLALSTHIRSPFALEATLPMIAHLGLCCLAAGIAHLRSRPADTHEEDWESAFEREEAERLDKLRAMMCSKDLP